jgi:Transposase DDE domain group 1
LQIQNDGHYVGDSYDFQGSNLTAYGGLLPVVTMLEKLQFRELIEQHVGIKRLTTSMPGYRFLLAMMLALYVGFSRLNHLQFLEREPMLTGILEVKELPVQSTFWRFLASLHLMVARQLLEVGRQMRQRVWQAAHVGLKEVTLDTDTTVQTVYGHQMGARKGYNPKHRGKKSYQRMSSEGWCIQWESTPPEQKSEFCSLGSREGRKLNPGSLSTKPSLGW